MTTQTVTRIPVALAPTRRLEYAVGKLAGRIIRSYATLDGDVATLHSDVADSVSVKAPRGYRWECEDTLVLVRNSDGPGIAKSVRRDSRGCWAARAT